ncbi:cation:proton antiporter [Myxococcota bacterium]|nr:cation:proton antiporter [Myxococcota bacterium]
MEVSAWVIVLLGLMIFLSHLFAGVFERTRIPDVLPLVLVGLLIGPVLGWLSADRLGTVGHVFTTASLVLILFEGGLDLNLRVLARSLSGGVRLAVINVLGVTAAVGALAHGWFDMDLLPALTLGTISAATASAVVIPMVSRLRVSDSARTVLVVEAALSDVLCIILVLGYLAAVGRDEPLGPAILGRMISSLLLATGIGGLSGVAWSLLLDRVRTLQTSMITTPAFVFVVFGITEILGFSGAVAALTFGFVLGNTESVQRGLHWLGQEIRVGHLLQQERDFFAELVFVMKTFFFVYIGILMPLKEPALVLGSLAIVGVTLLVRIPVVRIACPRRMGMQDAAVASVMVPKGLASAVLAALAADQQLSRGETVRDLAYGVILISILVTAILAFLVERGWASPLFRILYRDPVAAAETDRKQEG